jgi:chromosome segregation ATPase
MAAVAEQVHQLTAEVEDAARLAAAATQDLERAEASWDEIAEAREHLERAAVLERQLADVDAEADRLDDELRVRSRHGRKLKQDLDALEALPWFEAIKCLGERRRLSRDLQRIARSGDTHGRRSCKVRRMLRLGVVAGKREPL